MQHLEEREFHQNLKDYGSGGNMRPKAMIEKLARSFIDNFVP